MAVPELANLFREKDPIYIIVELTSENWNDAVEWTGADVIPPDSFGGPRLHIPNGEYDIEAAEIGDRIVKQGDIWQVWGAEDWAELKDHFIALDVPDV